MTKLGKMRVSMGLLKELLLLPEGSEVQGIEQRFTDLHGGTFMVYVSSVDLPENRGAGEFPEFKILYHKVDGKTRFLRFERVTKDASSKAE